MSQLCCTRGTVFLGLKSYQRIGENQMTSSLFLTFEKSWRSANNNKAVEEFYICSIDSQFVRLYIFIRRCDCGQLIARAGNQIANHVSYRGWRTHSAGGRCAVKEMQTVSSPDEAEAMCWTISFDFPTVRLAGAPGWFSTLPTALHFRAAPTNRLKQRPYLPL